MSLALTTRYADRIGVRVILLTPDRDDPRMVLVDTDKPVSPGAAVVLRNRAWLAVLDHRHSFHEPADVLEEPWEVRKLPGGAWVVRHESCGLRRAA